LRNAQAKAQKEKPCTKHKLTLLFRD